MPVSVFRVELLNPAFADPVLRRRPPRNPPVYSAKTGSYVPGIPQGGLTALRPLLSTP